MMNRLIKTGFFLFMLCGVTNMLLAQKEVKLTQEEVLSIHTSKDYIYGSGWDEIKENAISLALDELKTKLKNKNPLKSYKIAKLESDKGYYFLVYIEKNDPEPVDSTEVTQDNKPTIRSDTAIFFNVKKQTTEYNQNNAVTTSNTEINDLRNTRQYGEFIKRFKKYNRDNKLWGSGNKAEMTNANNCYVAIFKDNEMEVFLDKGANSRIDLLRGNEISDFETKYKGNNYKIVWIELIEE